jgi:hypothetical protein
VSQDQIENTATWVDQRYGSLLARLSRATLTASSKEVVGSLKPQGEYMDHRQTLKSYAGWLVETPLKKVGYGVSKPGTRVWILGGYTDNNISGILISYTDFNRHGRLIRPMATGITLITHHAMTRLFERLRTNALGEVIKIGLVPLTALPPPDVLGAEETIHIAGVGRFEAIAGTIVTCPGDLGWIMKTFIND